MCVVIGHLLIPSSLTPKDVGAVLKPMCVVIDPLLLPSSSIPKYVGSVLKLVFGDWSLTNSK